MSKFADKLVKYLSGELEVEPEKIENALNQITFNHSSAKKKKNTSVTKPTTKEDKKPTKEDKKPTKNGKCDRIIKKRDGSRPVCGKRAKNKLDNGEWRCGTEKTGCYAMYLKKAKTKKKSNPVTQANIKAEALINKVIKNGPVVTVKKVKGSSPPLYMDFKNRILYRENKVAYGVLDDDDKTILPLGDEQIRILEASNIEMELPQREDSNSHMSSEEPISDLDSSSSELSYEE